MAGDDKLKRMRSILWSIQQRRLEGMNEGPVGQANDGWMDAWEEVADAFREFDMDPDDLPDNPELD